MRTIIKGNEPTSLKKYRIKSQKRVAGYRGYDGLSDSDKDDLRESLAREQGNLCCYCCLGIQPIEGSMRIEHWKPKAVYPNLGLDYTNLLGACCGGVDGSKHEYHCDVSKKDRMLKYSPANRSHAIESKIGYYANGEIRSNCSEFDRQIEDVLNLNNEDLTSHRKQALYAIKRWKKTKSPNRKMVHAKITKLTDASRDMEPMSPVTVWYLRRIQKNS